MDPGTADDVGVSLVLRARSVVGCGRGKSAGADPAAHPLAEDDARDL